MTVEPRPRRPVVVVTGQSGAGKSSVLRALEDLGFDTVDNPPLRVVAELAAGDATVPLAIGIDARRADFDGAAAERVIAGLRARPELDVTLFFLIAEDEVLAVVAIKEGADFDPAELIEFLRPRMAHFMIPRYVRVVPDLPKTPTQKIEKHVLRNVGLTVGDAWDREKAGVSARRDA